MGIRRYVVKCTICGESTALVGEDIDRKYTNEFFAADGWSITKYKTMCPKCREKEKERFDQMMAEL